MNFHKPKTPMQPATKSRKECSWYSEVPSCPLLLCLNVNGKQVPVTSGIAKNSVTGAQRFSLVPGEQGMWGRQATQPACQAVL